MRHVVSRLPRTTLCALFLLVLGTFPLSAADVSNLKAGETVVLMPAAAHQSEDGRHWVVPLHASVYVPQNSHLRRAAIAELLKLRYGLDLTPASGPYFDARVNLLLGDNKRGRTIVVDIGGARATLPPTGANGHAATLVRIPVSAAMPDGGRLMIRAVLAVPDARKFETSAHLIGPKGLSVISDIDDTVKVTHVLDRRRMLEATFYKPFEAVDGMSAAYRGLAAKGTAVHYVSSSPWHLAEPLLEFLGASGLPVSSIALKQIRLKDRTALDIIKPGRETKPPQIEAILARYPSRRFILIGDSGEDDPEVYAEALRRHLQHRADLYPQRYVGTPGRCALHQDVRRDRSDPVGSVRRSARYRREMIPSMSGVRPSGSDTRTIPAYPTFAFSTTTGTTSFTAPRQPLAVTSNTKPSGVLYFTS